MFYVIDPSRPERCSNVEELRVYETIDWFPNGAVIVNGRYFGAWSPVARAYHALCSDLALDPEAYLCDEGPVVEVVIDRIDHETRTVTMGRKTP
jgi:hypothetical protein